MPLLQIYSCCLTQGNRTDFEKGTCLCVIFEVWNHNSFQEPVKYFINDVIIYVFDLVAIVVNLCTCIILSLTYTNLAFGKKILTKAFINKSFISAYFRYVYLTVYTSDITTLASFSTQWKELSLHILGSVDYFIYVNI